MSWLRKVPGMDIFLTKQIFITVDVAFGLYLLEFELRYVASSKRKGKGVKYIMSLCCAFLRRCWKDKSLYANVCFTQFRYILKYNFWILWNRSHIVHWTLLRYLACKRCNARCVRIGLAVRPSLWNSLLLSSEAGLAGPMLTLRYRGFLIKTKKNVSWRLETDRRREEADMGARPATGVAGADRSSGTACILDYSSSPSWLGKAASLFGENLRSRSQKLAFGLGICSR